MNRRTAVLVQPLVVLALFAVPSFAQDEEALKKDLTAVIALQGLPCGQVVAVKAQAQSDCRDVQGRKPVSRVSECGGARGGRGAEVASNERHGNG